MSAILRRPTPWIAATCAALLLDLSGGSPISAQTVAQPLSQTPTAASTDEAARIAALKRMEIRFMMRGARRKAARYAALRKARQAHAPVRAGGDDDNLVTEPPAQSGTGSAARPVRAGEPADPPGFVPREGSAIASPLAVAAGDQIVNQRAGDSGGSGQCEVYLAAHGKLLVAAWNDGEGFVTDSSTQGFGYSTDNGGTWVDGGAPPTTGGVGSWSSDPMVTVNEKTGAFYFAALCEPDFDHNGIGVVKGVIQNGQIVWGTPRVAVSEVSTKAVFDKEWLAADSLSGRLYLIYSRFQVQGGNITSNRIELCRNLSDNEQPWSLPVQLSDPGDAGRVQGARVLPGPDGDVWASWEAVGTAAQDHIRVRRGLRNSTYWEAQTTAASIYNNFGSGAPGFNRGTGFSFPSMSVDRGTGPTRGRVYLAWNESVNFYNDPLGGSGLTTEIENNDAPGSASLFTLGQTLIGTIANPNDLDYWRFAGVAGQTVICHLDTVTTTNLDASFRLFCTDGTTRLAFCETGTGGGNFAAGLIVFTLPISGTYYLRVGSLPTPSGDPPGTGSYRIITGINGPVTERARDHRDAFTAYTDDGVHWSNPVRVNNDPPHFDNWLPEVTAAANGTVFAAWYDWRDAPAVRCGGTSMTYMARSNDHGVTWTQEAPISTVSTNWTSVASNIAPNQGDYLALIANQNAVYAAWSDGRNGDPDIYFSTTPLPGQAALTGLIAQPTRVRIEWQAPPASIVPASVYRRTGSGPTSVIGSVTPDADGRIVYEDASVVAGTQYHYQLGWPDGSGTVLGDEVGVEVPTTFGEMGIRHTYPNPAGAQIWITFSLPTAEPATLDLLDLAGRRLARRTLSGPGVQTLEVAGGVRLPSGVYVVRIDQGGRKATTRVSVVR